MIISQTPYRVSFAGGGSDLPAFYRQEYGAVLSTTIDQHELVREAMRLAEIDEPLEITTIGDVPAGSGIGSSSSLTVGLLPRFTPTGTAWSVPHSWLSRPAALRSRYWASQSAARISTLWLTGD